MSMKKVFATIYFIASVATTSVNAAQYSYQPTRSTQVLAVIKKPVKAAQHSYQPTTSTQILAVIKKFANEDNVIVTQKEVNPSLNNQQTMEEPETVIEDVQKEEKTSSSSEKLVADTNSIDSKINSEKQAQEFAPASEEIITEINPANGVDLDKKLEEEKKYQANPISEMKTQGHYIGFDVIGMQGKFSEDSSKIRKGIQTDTSKPASTSTGGGVGFNYKYALNFNDFFIAPGIFVEGLGMQINGSESAHDTDAQYNAVTIRSRRGVFVDVGYDVNSYLSPYLMAGYSWVNYRTKNFYGNSSETQTAVEKSVVGSGIYGAGLKLNYDKSISFNIEFNTQKFNTKTNTDVPLNTSAKQYIAVFPTRLNTLKLGVSYNF
jgi:opacity protein-like surface antigen